LAFPAVSVDEQLHPALQVRKEHSDELALALEHVLGDEEFRAGVLARPPVT
jgi:hypothetical protein